MKTPEKNNPENILFIIYLAIAIVIAVMGTIIILNHTGLFIEKGYEKTSAQYSKYDEERNYSDNYDNKNNQINITDSYNNNGKNQTNRTQDYSNSRINTVSNYNDKENNHTNGTNNFAYDKKGSLHEENADISDTEIIYEEKSDEIKYEQNEQPLSNGYGFYIYSGKYKNYEEYIEIIKNYNTQTKEDNKKIKYALLWSGELFYDEDDRAVKVTYHDEITKYFRENLDSVKIISLIDASKEASSKINETSQEYISGEIADAINKDYNADGVNLDIEPSSEITEKLSELVKEKTQKIVSESVTKIVDDNHLNKIDFSILMNYGQCEDSFEEFYNDALKRFERYYRLCISTNSKCMHGIMITPTRCENNREDLKEYVYLSLQAQKKVLDANSKDNFIGICMFRLNLGQNATLSPEIEKIIIEES